MAHSGTTILTYVLKQHPDLILGVGGSETWIFENTWLPREQAEPIQELLAKYPDKRLLLKRPWNEVWHADWMKREMPNARFIYCYRDIDEITMSWSKTTSLVEAKLRNGGIDYQHQFYKMCWEKAETFGRVVPFFLKVYHPRFVENPQLVMADITAWAGLQQLEFDVSEVSYKSNIKLRLWRT